jgi:hypothetical protein
METAKSTSIRNQVCRIHFNLLRIATGFGETKFAWRCLPENRLRKSDRITTLSPTLIRIRGLGDARRLAEPRKLSSRKESPFQIAQGTRGSPQSGSQSIATVESCTSHPPEIEAGLRRMTLPHLHRSATHRNCGEAGTQTRRRNGPCVFHRVLSIVLWDKTSAQPQLPIGHSSGDILFPFGPNALRCRIGSLCAHVLRSGSSVLVP